MAESTEAPASLNFKVKTPKGFEIQLTARADLMHDLLTNFAKLEDILLEKGYTPLPYTNSGGFGKKEAKPFDPESPLACKLHTEMMREDKNGVYKPSHGRKLADGRWDNCDGTGYKSEKASS